MRLLLLVTDLELGGTPAVVRELAIGLSRDSAVHVEVACLSKAGPVGTQILAAGIGVSPLNARGYADISIVPRLIRVIERRSFDTVFSFLIHANAVAAAASVKCRDVRFIQSIQTTQPEPRWHWILQGVVQHACERIVVPSESVARAARDWSHVPTEKISVIPNAVNVEDFSELAGREVNHPVRRIGFIGRLDPIKRIGDLVSAMAHLDSEMRLDIFGVGSEEKLIEDKIAALNLQSRVALRGPVARPQEALREIDLLVLPSSAEGFGLVLIEAMAARIPVVATNVPGICEVVKDGISGLLVSAGDPRALAAAIGRIAGDDELRRTLIDGGSREVRERFSWESVLPEYRKLLGLE